MRTSFNFEGFGSFQTVVSKAELHIALPLLVEQADAFEVVNLKDGDFLIEWRSHNDNDHVLLKEHTLNKDTTK